MKDWAKDFTNAAWFAVGVAFTLCAWLAMFAFIVGRMFYAH